MKKQHSQYVILAFTAFASVFLYCLVSQRGINMIDYSYQTENAYRIFRGQVPYRDFYLVLTPGTYYLMALFMKLFGTGTVGQMVLISLIQLMTVLLTFLILRRLSDDIGLKNCLLLLLAGTGHTFLPEMNYDILSTLMILLNLYLTLLACDVKRKTHGLWCFLSGFSAFLPFLFKQNNGGVYLAVYLASLLCILLLRKISLRTALYAGLGTAVCMALFGGWILLSGIGTSIYHQTFVFPGTIRSFEYTLGRIWKQAVQDPHSIVYIFAMAICVILARINFLSFRVKRIAIVAVTSVCCLLFPFLWFMQDGLAESLMKTINITYAIMIAGMCMVAYLLIRRRQIHAGILFGLILTVIAALMSHGVYSSYGVWPLLILIIALLFRGLSEGSRRLIKPAAMEAILVLSCMFVCFALWVISMPRGVSAQGILQRKAAGLTTHDNSLADFEALVAYIDEEIPQEDSIVAWPGEDPLYWATERKPQMPYFQLLKETLPKTMDDIFYETMERKIDWVVLKTDPQVDIYLLNSGNLAQYISYLEYYDYRLAKELDRYLIYRRY